MSWLPMAKTNIKENNPATVALRSLKGGTARAARFTPERRKEIAVKAASARWGK